MTFRLVVIMSLSTMVIVSMFMVPAMVTLPGVGIWCMTTLITDVRTLLVVLRRRTTQADEISIVEFPADIVTAVVIVVI